MRKTTSLPARLPLAAFLGECIVLVGAYFVYAFTKTLVHSDPVALAFRNAWNIVDLELRLGIFHEPVIQRWFLEHARGAVHFLNVFYTIGYWPVILPAAIVLWWRDRAIYVRLRNVAFIAFGIVLAIYAFYPLAPPRMLPGFADTLMLTAGGLYHSTSDALLANAFAAMPSVHYGLAFLVAGLLWRSGGLLLKLTALLYQGLMLLSIIVTGNHYFLDVVAAILVVGVAFLGHKALSSWRRRPFGGVRHRARA